MQRVEVTHDVILSRIRRRRISHSITRFLDCVMVGVIEGSLASLGMTEEASTGGTQCQSSGMTAEVHGGSVPSRVCRSYLSFCSGRQGRTCMCRFQARECCYYCVVGG